MERTNQIEAMVSAKGNDFIRAMNAFAVSERARIANGTAPAMGNRDSFSVKAR